AGADIRRRGAASVRHGLDEWVAGGATRRSFAGGSAVLALSTVADNSRATRTLSARPGPDGGRLVDPRGTRAIGAIAGAPPEESARHSRARTCGGHAPQRGHRRCRVGSLRMFGSG